MDRQIYEQESWSQADITLLKTEFGLINHQTAVRFACDCAERVCKRVSADRRAYAAILAGRGWAEGISTVSEARAAAFAAHAAAREAKAPDIQFAIRSAGHAAATAHVVAHAVAAADYAAKAAADARKERAWQYAHLVSMLQNIPDGLPKL
jgi:hypothetical protein